MRRFLTAPCSALPRLPARTTHRQAGNRWMPSLSTGFRFICFFPPLLVLVFSLQVYRFAAPMVQHRDFLKPDGIMPLLGTLDSPNSVREHLLGVHSALQISICAFFHCGTDGSVTGARCDGLAKPLELTNGSDLVPGSVPRPPCTGKVAGETAGATQTSGLWGPRSFCACRAVGSLEADLIHGKNQPSHGGGNWWSKSSEALGTTV